MPKLINRLQQVTVDDRLATADTVHFVHCVSRLSNYYSCISVMTVTRVTDAYRMTGCESSAARGTARLRVVIINATENKCDAAYYINPTFRIDRA